MTVQDLNRIQVAPRSTAADYTMLRICLWSVALYCGLGLLGFAVFAGFWPPPAEHLDAEGITAYFREHETGIRVGMVLMAAGAPFYFVWSVVLSKIIGRIEGPMGPLSMVELIGGLLTAVVTLVPPTIWVTAAFRVEERSAESVQLMYDFGWFFFDLTFVCSILQNVALAIAIFRDRRPAPLLPRWIAYVALLTSATYVPLTLLPFAQTGPFAWHGLLNFWAVFVMFFVLIACATPFAFKALRRLEQEDAEGAVRA